MEQPPKQVESDRVLFTVLEDAEYSHGMASIASVDPSCST